MTDTQTDSRAETLDPEAGRASALAEADAYLTRYGYLEPKSGARRTSGADSHVDDGLRAGLRRFQRFAGLPGTGLLDEATTTALSRPRCGEPDFVGAETRRSAGASAPAATDAPAPYRIGPHPPQSKTTLTWRLLNFPSELAGGVAIRTVRHAFDMWQNAFPTLQFSEAPTGSQPDLFLRFAFGAHCVSEPFTTKILAHAPSELPQEIHVNDEYVWVRDDSVPDDPKEWDLKSVVAHEIGHLLGLGHSDNPTAIMYPFNDAGFEPLHQDDIDGVRAIYLKPAPGWFGWVNDLPDGTFTTSPSVVVHDDILHVFALGTDRAVWHVWWDGSSWAMASDLPPGTFRSAPGAVVHDGVLHVFGRGDDDNVWHTHWTGGFWAPWKDDLGPGVTTSAPSAVVHDGVLHVFAQGADRNIWHTYWDGQSWSVWMDDLGHGSFVTAPSAVVHDGVLHVFGVGDDKGLWHAYWDGQQWIGWTDDAGAGAFTTAPIAVSHDGVLHVVAKGTDTDLWHATWSDGAWSGWRPDTGPGRFILGVGGAGHGDLLHLFSIGADHTMWHTWKE